MAGTGGQELEWVEILEPETGKKMYANTVTGDCRWDPPEDGAFKATHSNQWWELHDAKSSRSYYFNATSHTTVWERPKGGDIVALAKLQAMQEQLAREEAELEAAEAADRQRRLEAEREAAAAEAQRKQAEEAARRQRAEEDARSAQAAQAGQRRATTAATSAPPPAPAQPGFGRTQSTGAVGGKKGPPTAPKPAALLAAKESDTQLEGYKENLAVHKKGIFRKKVRLRPMPRGGTRHASCVACRVSPL